LDLSGFFRFLHGWIFLLKRLDTTGFSPAIRINWNYVDYAYSFMGKFTLSKNSIPVFLHLTLELIGIIWIVLIPLSVNSPF
jgi:hypothetical protein